MNVFWKGKLIEVKNSTVYPAPYIDRKKSNFVSFRVDGGGVLEVVCDEAFESAVIRPKSLPIKYDTKSNSVIINVDKACNFSLEFNNSIDYSLQVFAIGEDNIDRSDYEHIVCIGSGVHNSGCIEIESDNTLLYIDDGAYIHGKIYAKEKKISQYPAAER